MATAGSVTGVEGGPFGGAALSRVGLPFLAKANASRRSRAPCIDSLGKIRLAYIAAETGARFVRERSPVEPIQWLLTPNVLFDGQMAIDACQSAQGFDRALVLHGLELALDGPPPLIAGILPAEFLSNAGRLAVSSAPPDFRRSAPHEDDGRPALYSCTISTVSERGYIHVFCAMIAPCPSVVRSRLRQRYGSRLEDEAVVRLGFDWSEPMACAMVSEAMAHVLTLAAEEPTSALADGLDFQVEQRFMA